MPSRMSTPVHDPRLSRLSGAVDRLLDEIERRFRLLRDGPEPLAVDGAQVGHGLPRRLIPLPELAAILMHPSRRHTAEAVLAALCPPGPGQR